MMAEIHVLIILFFVAVESATIVPPQTDVVLLALFAAGQYLSGCRWEDYWRFAVLLPEFRFWGIHCLRHSGWFCYWRFHSVSGRERSIPG